MDKKLKSENVQKRAVFWMGWGRSDTSDDRWQGGTDPLTKIQGSDTWVLLDTQKTQRFLRVNPPENVAIKTRKKNPPQT